MRNARYYSYETCVIAHRDAMRCYLKMNKIVYELSGCFDAYHFEIRPDAVAGFHIHMLHAPEGEVILAEKGVVRQDCQDVGKRVAYSKD